MTGIKEGRRINLKEKKNTCKKAFSSHEIFQISNIAKIFSETYNFKTNFVFGRPENDIFLQFHGSLRFSVGIQIIF